MLDKEVLQVEKDIDKMTKVPNYKYTMDLNQKPLSERQISEKVELLNGYEEKLSKKGTISGNFYFPTDLKHKEFIQDHCKKFMYSNPLHFDQARGPVQIEKELLVYMIKLFNGNEETYGSVSCGGTESIFVAAYALREHARRKGIEHPEIIINEMAHIAIFKACYYLNMKLIQIPTDDITGLCSTADYIKQITPNTIAFYMSGINYATGLVDQVGEINDFLLGKKKNSDPVNQAVKKQYNHVGIIVDSCLGGYMTSISSHLKDNRFLPIDFRLPKVFAITSDPHKYGQGPKGCSVVMFKNLYLKRCSMYMAVDWSGGVYGTPTMTGSRSALPSVGSWISLQRLGMEGLIKCYHQITETIDHLREEINAIPELYVIGEPKGCSIGFAVRPEFSKKFNIMILNDEINKKHGFLLSICTSPRSIHISLTMNNVNKMRSNMASAIKESMKYYRENLDEFKNVKTSDMKLYGTLVSVPTQFSKYILEHAFAYIHHLKPCSD